MTISIKNLDHVVLRVADIDRAVRFYCDVLGCSEERRLESIGLVQLRAGDSLIDLVPREPGEAAGPGNMDHFALRIDPFEAVAIGRHLERHGVKFGDVETRYGADGDGPSIYLDDLDGNVVELKGPAADRA
ncbi:MAG: VOC family protein [Alphaproteobacteria bacterium]|nr:VOC family protein [Alphaproteobacteria bacterium]